MKTRRLVPAIILVLISASVSSASADSQVEKAFSLLKTQLAERRGFLLDRMLGAGSALISANARQWMGASHFLTRMLKHVRTEMSYMYLPTT